MKTKTIIAALIFMTALTGLPLFSNPADADSLLRKVEQVINPEIYSSVMQISTQKPGQRDSEIGMNILYKEGSGSFIEMTEPARSRGIRMLELDSSLYLYNPKSNSRRPIRLSPEQSFQGTVFSNNDVSDPRYSDDYNAQLSGEELIDHPDFGKTQCLVLTAEAKTREAPYGKIVIWIHKEKLIPLKFDYYAKSGLLFKTMILKDYRQMAGDLRPATMHMDSLELEGAWSEVKIESMEALKDIPDSRFSTAALIR